MCLRISAVVFALLFGLPNLALAKDARVYFFGNSLINHLGGGDQTSVPYWLGQMAQEAGVGFAADGQWGFLRDFTRAGDPLANWSFAGVPSAWPGRTVPFEEADLTHIVVNPANFIQYQAPDVPYDGDNPEGVSALSAMLELLETRGGARPLLIYEGWAEMAAVTGRFPPRARGLRKYHAHNMGVYHDWYVTLLAQMRAAAPEARLRLVPVAQRLSQLLSAAPLKDVPVEALYLDDAPHGTPTLYFLAALILYPALYDSPPPAQMRLPETIHPLVANNLEGILAQIAALEGDETQAQAPPARPAPQGAVPEGQLENPSLAFGLDGISDWSTQHPFLNIMKTARPWVGHVDGNWGALQMEDLARRGLLDAHGYPRRLPAEAQVLESFVLTDQPPEATDMASRYRIRWKGEGRLTVRGRGQTTRGAPGASAQKNEIWFTYTPGEGLVSIAIESTDPNGTGAYIRDIEILREDHIPLYEAGAVFNPAWIERIANARSLRFMDWMITNGSPVTSWPSRPREAHFSYAWRGVPAELILRLANKVGADPWICMPHAADDGYVRAFAQLTQAKLDPRLKAYVEYSNELWNHIFPQTGWVAQKADARWNVQGDSWMQFAGLRAAEVMQIWSQVFDDEAKERLVRVMGVHTGWPGLEEPFLNAPLAVAEGLSAPRESFDAYAVSGYFGFDLGLEEEGLPAVRRSIAKSVARAKEGARATGLQRRALEEEIRDVKFDAAFREVAQMLSSGSFQELTETLWPYHAARAAELGMTLVMYEGGTHVTPHGAAIDDEELVAFFTAFNYTPEMGALYEALLRHWHALGGQMFNAFVDVAPPSKYGSWGALRHLQDDNPRWDALMAANAVLGAPARAPGTFLQGVTRIGGQGADDLLGSPEEDVLIGGPGDDRMVSGGGADHFHGGTGFDRVTLPGRFEAYQFFEHNGLIHARRGAVTSYLRDVELLYFDEEPTRKYRLSLK